MRTDNLIYQFFEENPQKLFHLLGESPPETAVYQFNSLTFKDVEKRMDGVMIPSESALPTIFLESQYYFDKSFRGRFSLGIHLFLNERWKRNQADPEGSWQSVVIYPHQKAAGPAQEDFKHFFESDKVREIILDELDESQTADLFIQALILTTEKNPAVFENKVQKIVRSRTRLAKNEQERLLNFLRSLIIKTFKDITTEGIEKMLNFDTKWKDTAIYKEFAAEGRKEGKRIEIKKNILRILELKFSKADLSNLIKKVNQENRLKSLEKIFDLCLTQDSLDKIDEELGKK